MQRAPRESYGRRVHSALRSVRVPSHVPYACRTTRFPLLLWISPSNLVYVTSSASSAPHVLKGAACAAPLGPTAAPTLSPHLLVGVRCSPLQLCNTTSGLLPTSTLIRPHLRTVRPHLFVVRQELYRTSSTALCPAPVCGRVEVGQQRHVADGAHEGGHKDDVQEVHDAARAASVARDLQQQQQQKTPCG